jgi:hypothetical protein
VRKGNIPRISAPEGFHEVNRGWQLLTQTRQAGYGFVMGRSSPALGAIPS